MDQNTAAVLRELLMLLFCPCHPLLSINHSDGVSRMVTLSLTLRVGLIRPVICIDTADSPGIIQGRKQVGSGGSSERTELSLKAE